MSDDIDLDMIERNLAIVHQCGILHARCVVDRLPDLIAEVRRLRARLAKYEPLEQWQQRNGEATE